MINNDIDNIEDLSEFFINVDEDYNKDDRIDFDEDDYDEVYLDKYGVLSGGLFDEM